MTVPYTFATAVGLVPASELDVNFAYVSNNVSTANTVVANAQPNITSVGTLANLSVAGNVIAARLKGDGGNISNIQGANVSGAVANATYAVTANSANSATYSTNSIQANIANIANLVVGSNVSGSVAQANIANIANLVVGSNVSGQVANALIAGTVYTNAQPNITSVGTLTSLSTSGNITGANLITGGQISVTGNVTGGNLSGTNIEGTLTTASQTNITIVGILNSLSATGNIRTGGQLSATGNVTGANVNVGNGNVNVGNVVFALDSSKFNSAKWTLVESFANVNTYSTGNSSVNMTQTFSYYASNYNEFMIKLYPLAGNQYQQTITFTNVPLNAVAAGDEITIATTWNNQPALPDINWSYVSWANLSSNAMVIHNLYTGAGDNPSIDLYIYAR